MPALLWVHVNKRLQLFPNKIPIGKG